MSEERAVVDALVVRWAPPSAAAHHEGVAGGADGELIFEEFEADDPRRGPHSVEVQQEAARLAEAPGRWHGRNVEVDWLAIELTVGRGVLVLDVSCMFCVGESRIYKLKKMRKWSAMLTEDKRRRLSVLVWLAGFRRVPEQDTQRRERLKAASEWRLPERETPQSPRKTERQGAKTAPAINEEIPEEIPDDAYFSHADPKREERRAVMDKLEARLRELEAQWRNAGGDVEGEIGPADRAGEGQDEMDDLAERMDQSGDGAERLATVGEAGAASA
jgi:hypothetical protein